MTTAICGDMGPVVKIGEASIATHMGLKGAALDPVIGIRTVTAQ